MLLTMATQPRQRRRQGEHCHHDDRGGANHLCCLLFRMSGLLDVAVSLRISLRLAFRAAAPFLSWWALPVVVVPWLPVVGLRSADDGAQICERRVITNRKSRGVIHTMKKVILND
jgi:hypothetical protein